MCWPVKKIPSVSPPDASLVPIKKSPRSLLPVSPPDATATGDGATRGRASPLSVPLLRRCGVLGGQGPWPPLHAMPGCWRPPRALDETLGTCSSPSAVAAKLTGFIPSVPPPETSRILFPFLYSQLPRSLPVSSHDDAPVGSSEAANRSIVADLGFALRVISRLGSSGPWHGRPHEGGGGKGKP